MWISANFIAVLLILQILRQLNGLKKKLFKRICSILEYEDGWLILVNICLLMMFIYIMA